MRTRIEPTEQLEKDRSRTLCTLAIRLEAFGDLLAIALSCKLTLIGIGQGKVDASSQRGQPKTNLTDVNF